MSKKESKGVMSEEAKAKIARAVREAAARKRAEQGLPPIGEDGIPERTKDLELVQMRNQNFDPDLFVPMKTGKEVDKLFSTDGGVPKATNYMIVGDPGVGKSTVTLDILADLNEAGYSCIFISAEMTRIDLYQYVLRYPKFGNIPILFLGEYLDDNPKDVMEEALKPGYDVVLIDSFAEVQEAVKEVNKMSTAGSEKWLIDTMIRQNLGDNDGNKNTTFLCIQQVTKGGVFVGSNKLKHNTTGMMEMRFDDDSGISAYIMFSKNRRGPVNRKMYFSLQSTGDVEYDGRRFNSDEGAREAYTEERRQMEEEENAFDKLLGTGQLGLNMGDKEFDL